MKSGLLYPLSDVASRLVEVPRWLLSGGMEQSGQGLSWSGWLLPVIAQVQEQAPAVENAAPNGAPEGFLEFLTSPLNLILISAILFMFLVARPQQKQRKEQEQALAELKKNDRVVTASGIHGVVVQSNLEEALVTIRIDENSGARMTVNRDAIAKIIPSDSKE